MPSYILEECTNITDIEILDSVTRIEYDAFSGCSGLEEIQYKGTIEQWKAIQKGNSWDWDTGDYTVYCMDGNLTKKEA